LRDAAALCAMSKTNIHHTIQKHDIIKTEPVHKPLLTPQHIEDRINFAAFHLLARTNFNHVTFSDEKIFRCVNNTCVVQSASEPRPVLEDRAQYPASVMVWGAMSFFGKTKIHIFKQGKKIKSEIYSNTAIASYLSSAHELHPNFFAHYNDIKHPLAVSEQFTFMHDGASVHTAQHTREMFHLMGINVLKNWPAHSPDLNPKENVWGWMARKISKHAPTTRDELIQLIIHYWDSVTVNMRRALFASVPLRLLQVLERCGHHTDY
jgi:hypothetical protein